DPKENGAVLIVLWNVLILHARWCGLVKDRGVAVLTLGGNMITTWSYFGTNQLGVGLHAYGFSNALAFGCVVTWILHLLMIGVGMIPLKYWRSFAKDPLSAATTAESPPGTSPAQPTAAPSPPNGPGANGPPNQGNGRGRRPGQKR